MSIAALRELASTENDDVLTEMLTAGLDRWTMYRLLKLSYSSLPPSLHSSILSYLLPLQILNFNFSSCTGPLRVWFKPTRTNNQVPSPLQYMFIFHLWSCRSLPSHAVNLYFMSSYRELSSIFSFRFVRTAVTLTCFRALCCALTAKWNKIKW